MAVETHIYDQHFFDNTMKFESQSAQAVVNILQNHFHPQSVIDIGCGCGVYLKVWQDLGVEILGYDGAPAALEKSLVGDKIKLWDLSQPLKLEKKFDLCLCAEVAEHLEAQEADTLVETLINSSDLIVFTAATPGQGPRSIGHINEQPHEYWIEKFQARGFKHNIELSEKISAEMESQKVVWWIVKNLMIFEKQS